MSDIEQNINKWGSNPMYKGETPDEVKSVHRFLTVMYQLQLCKHFSYYRSTSRLKVARMVIKRLMELP